MLWLLRCVAFQYASIQSGEVYFDQLEFIVLRDHLRSLAALKKIFWRKKSPLSYFFINSEADGFRESVRVTSAGKLRRLRLASPVLCAKESMWTNFTIGGYERRFLPSFQISESVIIWKERVLSSQTVLLRIPWQAAVWIVSWRVIIEGILVLRGYINIRISLTISSFGFWCGN